MEKYAVIVAGGTGTRMGSAVPKQFLEINNVPLISYTIASFIGAFNDVRLIIVLPQSHLDSGKEMLQKLHPGMNMDFVAGGETRFHSVSNGLKLIPEPSIVFIHDAVRCLVGTDLIRRCYDHAITNGSAIPVVPIKDSLRLVETDQSSRVLNREKVRAVQTPQTFQSALIRKAFEQPYRQDFTDEATVLESAGFSVSLIEGEDLNVKITYPSDVLLAHSVLSQKK